MRFICSKQITPSALIFLGMCWGRCVKAQGNWHSHIHCRLISESHAHRASASARSLSGMRDLKPPLDQVHLMGLHLVTCMLSQRSKHHIQLPVFSLTQPCNLWGFHAHLQKKKKILPLVKNKFRLLVFLKCLNL